MIRTFGIRHHGPGSARRLQAALADWQPDLLLIEMPADANKYLSELTHSGMRPPVALVIHDAKDIALASFYPFTTFSPEYQAITWATERDVPIRAIDLPARFQLARAANRPAPTLFSAPQPPADKPSFIPGKTQQRLREQLRHDPLSLMAELAGYADSESWWDATLERGTDKALDTFAALTEMVGELRATFPEAADEENAQREAFMRTEIRKALKSGAQRIAVVVGAWHSPAVATPGQYRAAADKALLRGLPKVKIAVAWVPWSYPRLAKATGYGAGVTSPHWYALLYEDHQTATSRWMATAARMLRAAGYDASPALAAEGVALATTLATLRAHDRPGIEELEQALLGTLAGGRAERLALIHRQLTVGEAVGFVPPGATTVPLLTDLNRELKSTRMAQLWEKAGAHYLKANKAAPRGGIDLRQPNDLRKSHLLHRLQLLEIPWGQLQPDGPESLGSFREIWLLEWQPEFSLFLIERASYGNTLAQAAANYVREQARNIRTVPPLSAQILACLQADLSEVVPELLRALRDRAAETTDCAALLAALPALVRTSRYGDSRKTDTTALLLVIDELLPRLTAGLPAAVANIDETQATDLLPLVAGANYALAQLDNPVQLDIWASGLRRTAASGNAHPLLEGYCVRLLFDRQLLVQAAVAQRLHLALSAGHSARHIAQWLAGFLHGSGQLLFHYQPLWTLVDDWLAGLGWTDFEAVLPLLRRTFADFSSYDRQRLLQRAIAEEAPPVEMGVPAATEDVPDAPESPEPSTPPQDDTLLAALLNWIR